MNPAIFISYSRQYKKAAYALVLHTRRGVIVKKIQIIR